MSDAYVSSSDWANLPTNLLDSIVERFWSSSDYVCFSLVCTSWFGVAKHNQGRFAEKLSSHPEPPMLLFFNNNEEAWNLYNVVAHMVLDVQLKMPNKRFCGSWKGWLIHVERDFTITLTKPVFYKSDKRGKREDLVVRLPELNPPNSERDKFWGEQCEYFAIKAVITADPILDADEYIVILTYMKHYAVAFIRPSKDTTWTYLKTFHVDDVLPHGGDKFYALHCEGDLETFSFSSKSKTLDAKYLPCELPSTFHSLKKYLVEDGKDLLMVDKSYDHEGGDHVKRRFAMDFRVYKFNFDNCKWITLLKDVALFVGENELISVAASNFRGCWEDCIYYNHDAADDLSIPEFGMYDMVMETSKPYTRSLMTLLSLTDKRPIWFTPSIHL